MDQLVVVDCLDGQILCNNSSSLSKTTLIINTILLKALVVR